MELLSVPLITGVIQALKLAGLPTKYSPIASVFLGMVAALILLDDSYGTRLALGVIFGLSASGLYDNMKVMAKLNPS